MNSLTIQKAVCWLRDHDIPIPMDIAIKTRAMKAEADTASINKDYHDAITAALIDYFEGGSIGASRNAFKQAVIQAFGDMFDIGWQDGGQDLPVEDEDALGWLEARLNQEVGFVDLLFQEAKELRKEEDFDYFSWISSKSDGYTNTLREVYNAAKLRASEDKMVTFDGDDGEESCEDCQKLKGKRHKISWFVKRNYVPPFGTGLQCHKGGHCAHGLFDDEGNQVTI